MENKSSHMDILSEISMLLTQDNDGLTLTKSIFEILKKKFPIDDFNIYVWDENTDTIRDFAKSWIVIDRDSQIESKKKLYQILDDFQTYDFIINENVYEMNSLNNFKIDLQKNENILYYPMKKNNKPYGILELKLAGLTKELFHVSFFKGLSIGATAIALRVQNDILVDQMQANIDFHDSMKNIAKIIETQYELNYIIPLIGEMLDKFIADHLIYIFLKNQEDGDYKLVWPLACRDEKILKLMQGIKEKRHYILSADQNTGLFPLVGENEILGCVVAHSNMDKLTQKEIEYLEQLTKQSSITIHRANVYAEVLKHATLDALTGINNRRQFESRLKQEFATSKRQKTPLCAMMIDIDFFKNVNDTYGHAVGDEVLKHTANIIKEQLREYDIPSRYGGEEFAVLLPFTRIEEAFLVAQRLRIAVEKSKVSIKDQNKTLNVTISIGVTEYTDEDTPESLFERADKALYDAKKHGRNKVVINE